MSTSTAPAPVAASESEVRVRNVLGQKPRTASEESKAWGRRFNRWHKNHLAAGVPAADLEAIYKGKASKAQLESKAGLLFVAMSGKAIKVLGKADAAAIYAAGPRSVA